MRSPRAQLGNTTFPLLTWTSAMQCWSFSLPAGRNGSCPFSLEDDPTSICSSCYAMQGRYIFRTTRTAQRLRLDWLKLHLLPGSGGGPDFAAHTLIKAIDFTGARFFRVHDSGDFFSLPYIHLWRRICSALPHTNFWIPTRAYRFPHWIPALTTLNDLPNVVVRPSATRVGAPTPTISGLSLGHGLISHPSESSPTTCPKSLNHSSCATEECRRCWHNHPVDFLYHGHALTSAERRLATLTIGST